MKKLLVILGLITLIVHAYAMNNQLMTAQVGMVAGVYPSSISGGQLMDCFNGTYYESNAVYAAYDYSSLLPGSYIRLLPVNPESSTFGYLMGAICGFNGVPGSLQNKYGYWYDTVTLVASNLNY